MRGALWPEAAVDLKRDEVVCGNEGRVWSGEDVGDEVCEGRESVPASEGEGAGGFGVEGCSEGDDAEDLDYSLSLTILSCSTRTRHLSTSKIRLDMGYGVKRNRAYM
jgi:hypothetical protein